MTVEELKEVLNKYPNDSIIMYRHNKYSRIDIDKIDCKEEIMPSGNKIHTLTFEADYKED